MDLRGVLRRAGNQGCGRCRRRWCRRYVAWRTPSGRCASTSSVPRVNLFGINDDQGNSIVVSVTWVGFYTRGDAREFKRLDDVHGSGNVTPLVSTLLGLADISFTGHHYQSRPNSKTTIIAEAEPTTGHVSDEVLDAVAKVPSLTLTQPIHTPARWDS